MQNALWRMQVVRRDRLPSLVALGLALFAAARPAAGLQAQPPAPEDRFPQAVSVAETFDKQPLAYRIESRTEKAGYVVYRVTYPSPVVTPVARNNTVPAEYYVPQGLRPGGPKRPAVICLHILDGNMELVRMQCTVLATHGVPAILFMLPYYGERGVAEGPAVMATNPRLFVDAIAQGIDDARRTVDVLASRPEIDPGRIGITGISLGGIAAVTVAGRDPRLRRVMPILAGGDLLAIIHHARETADLSRLLRSLPAQQRSSVEAAIRGVDPLQVAAALRDRARAGGVLMINAAEDEVIPRACTEKLAAALGLSDRVEWLGGLGHYTSMAALPRVVERMVEFFAQDLPPGTKVPPPPAARVRTPAQTALGLLQEAIALVTDEPAAGRCHFADLAVEIALSGQQPSSGRVLFVRGSEGRFKLQCRLPVVGEVAMGQGAYLWMTSTRKTFFRGVGQQPQAGGGQTRPVDPLAFTAADNVLRLRMLAGVLGAAAMAPDVLDPWVALAEEPSARGPRSIRIILKGPNRGSARLLLGDDGRSPQSLSFEMPGAAGNVKFLGWQTNTVVPAAVFDPPSGLAPKDVPVEQLQRMISAMFDFAVDRAD
jgi:dienelactone hydrolase